MGVEAFTMMLVAYLGQSVGKPEIPIACHKRKENFLGTPATTNISFDLAEPI